ncbi:hypothetical protein BDZ85DRAFT_129181 [Elsinoe ampelina]|uniref:DUF7732 domain-containing protein n=1 Tax=Elsinoe ampelina TaxID=302913 RepID=A0A6A6G9X4_9PEZI|nr:hypothetical protein BDZ85DRAFT_129181 [Elsinoe ampelina]
MKVASYLLCLYGITSTTSASVIPDSAALAIRDLISESIPHQSDLIKRKGGGSSSGSSSSSSGSSGSRGSTGSSGSTGTSARTGSGSNVGGSTSRGSGPAPSYGGGRYYGGGAAVPYSAGVASPRARINPLFIAAPALAFGGLWAYGAFAYPYSSPYSFRNVSRNNATNESIPVQCWCGQYQSCGCDDNGDRSYLDGIVGNGTGLNQTLARVVDLNGTQTLVINGSLPNGTTAPGGTDDDVVSSGAVKLGGFGEFSGWWMMLATVGSIVYFA